MSTSRAADASWFPFPIVLELTDSLVATAGESSRWSNEMIKLWVIGETYLWRSKEHDPARVVLRSGPGPFGLRGARRKLNAEPLPSGPVECEVEPAAGGAS